MFGFDRRRRGSSGPAAPRSRRWLIPLLVGMAVAGVLTLAIGPARAHFERTADIAEAEAQLAELVATNRADAEAIAALDTDAELERQARNDYGLARPGEEIYVVLPPAADPPVVPQGWPFTSVGLRLATP
jgi:cell division protein FtsB